MGPRRRLPPSPSTWAGKYTSSDLTDFVLDNLRAFNAWGDKGVSEGGIDGDGVGLCLDAVDDDVPVGRLGVEEADALDDGGGDD